MIATRKGNPLDCVAWIAIEYMADGTLQTSGNIGDKRMALQLLDHARDAIANQQRPEDKPIVLPNRDVEVKQHPNYPTLPRGDMQ